MPFSSLVNGPSKGNEGTYVLPLPPNHASFRTHNPTLCLRPYRFPQGTFSSACGGIHLVRGYPGHQAN